jgi:hypothetical protein
MHKAKQQKNSATEKQKSSIEAATSTQAAAMSAARGTNLCHLSPVWQLLMKIATAVVMKRADFPKRMIRIYWISLFYYSHAERRERGAVCLQRGMHGALKVNNFDDEAEWKELV